MNKKKSIFIALCIIILIALDYSSSKYNSGILFNRYNQIKFNFNIIKYEGRYHIWSDSAFAIIYNGVIFPNIPNKKNVVINEIHYFSCINNNLGVLIENDSANKIIIKINSLGYDGAVSNYKIISDSINIKKMLKDYNWIDIRPSMILHFYIVFWPKLFWFLLIVIILNSVVNIYKWRFKNQI